MSGLFHDPKLRIQEFSLKCRSDVHVSQSPISKGHVKLSFRIVNKLFNVGIEREMLKKLPKIPCRCLRPVNVIPNSVPK